MDDILGIFLISTIVTIVVIVQVRMIYLRYFKSFHTDSIEYLSLRNLEFIASRKPNIKDWENSPFKRVKDFEISFVNITIAGVPVNFTTKKYRLITYRQKEKEKQLWLEIQTSFFKKTKLNFHKGS